MAAAVHRGRAPPRAGRIGRQLLVHVLPRRNRPAHRDHGRRGGSDRRRRHHRRPGHAARQHARHGRGARRRPVRRRGSRSAHRLQREHVHQRDRQRLPRRSRPADRRYRVSLINLVAEGVGFEPTETQRTSTAFEAVPFVRSGILPSSEASGSGSGRLGDCPDAPDIGRCSSPLWSSRSRASDLKSWFATADISLCRALGLGQDSKEGA